MSSYVICASCGARIKANRQRCLRCDEPLVAAAAAPAPLQLPGWMTASTGRMVMIGGGASIVLLLAIAAIVKSTSADVVDDVARPAPGAPLTASRPAAVARPGDAVAARSEPFTPVTALDSTRLANAAYNVGDLDAAKARFEQAVARNPDDAEAMNGIGQVLVRQGQIEEAMLRFSQAIRLAPDNWAYRFNLARAEGQLGRWDAAIADYRTAAGLFPTDYATQYNLAMALHKKGNDEAAIPEFKHAIELAPSEPSFHLSLAISLEKTGQLADARREYATYLEMEPSAPEAEKLKAHLQALASGQPPKSAS